MTVGDDDLDSLEALRDYDGYHGSEQDDDMLEVVNILFIESLFLES